MSAFRSTGPDWNALMTAAVSGPARRDGNAITVPTTIGDMSISLYEYGARLTIGGERSNDYGLVISAGKDDLVALNESAEEISIESATHKFSIEKNTLAFRLAKSGKTLVRSATDGHFVRAYRLPPFAKNDWGWYVNLDLSSNDQIYGLGEKWGPLNKRGQLIHSFNHDALGVNAEASYKNTPFAWSPRGWGVFCHTPAPVVHGVGFAPWSQRAYGFFVEDAHLDLFFFTGADGAEIIKQYTDLTGRSPTPPDWSFGVITSKAFYQDADELLTTAREIRRRGMPCDTLTLDGRAWLDTSTRFSFEWDKTRYPDPRATLSELKEMNFKICVWEYPLVSMSNPLFLEMASNGWLLRNKETGAPYEYHWDMEPFGDVLTPLPVSGLVDFTHPDAFAYWRDRHAELFDVGVDMIKADFGEQVLDDMVAHNGETGRALHNVYAFLYNKCVYEAAEKYGKSGAFLFSRSSWVGCQRFPSQWGGDPQADWEGLAASLRGGLSWGMSGSPYYATDIGGFYGDKRDPKLYVRWLQAGLFSAHIRLHGIGAREPWSYGPIAERAAMAALKLRYRLLPYIKRVAQESRDSGLPAQRAMPLALPHEPQAWQFDDQFFFGDDMLVAPCLSEDDRVSVYLPNGKWRRFLSGEVYDGGSVREFHLALDEMAVFVRDTASIPLGPEIEYSELNKNLTQVESYWPASA